MNPDEWISAMPAERMIAILRYRGMETEALVMAHCRNIETMMEATGNVARDMEEIAARQVALVQDSIDHLSEALPKMAKTRTLDQLARSHIDFSHQAMSAAVANFQQIGDVLFRCNASAVDMIRRSMMDTLERMSGQEPPERD